MYVIHVFKHVILHICLYVDYSCTFVCAHLCTCIYEATYKFMSLYVALVCNTYVCILRANVIYSIYLCMYVCK